MQCIKTIFVVEIVSCFLDVFFKTPKFISILHIPRQFHYFRQITFYPVLISVTSRPRANIRELKGRKPMLSDGQRNKRHKSQKKYKKSDIMSVKICADLNNRPFSKLVGANVRLNKPKFSKICTLSL